MTPIADMVEQMLADGIAGSAIVLAIRTIEQRDVTLRNALPETVVLSSSPAAIKQRRYRENLKQKQSSAKANDVALGGDQSAEHQRNALRNGVTVAVDTSFLSIKEEGTSEKGREEKKKEVVGVTRERGTRLADDWQPSEVAANFARGLGLDPAALRDEFVDFWSAVPGSRGLKLNWDKTYKNRAREVAGRRQNARQNPGNVITAADKLVDRMRALAGPPAVRSGTGTAPVRLIQAGRCERPRDVRDVDRGDPERLPDGNDALGDGPTDGPSEQSVERPENRLRAHGAS